MPGEGLSHVPALIWVHAVSDGLMAAACLSVPLVFNLLRKRREPPFRLLYPAIAWCALLCGFLHVIDLCALFCPLGWLDGLARALAALALFVTVVLLFRHGPR